VAFAIFDTGVYVDHWERGLHTELLQKLTRSFVIRQSAVVLSELRRGARTAGARRLVESLRRIAPEVWEPTAEDWWVAAEIIRTIGDAHDWETSKRREFQNDVLIALTAVRHGASVVTTNTKDFQLLERVLRFRMVAL
jgi:predicted nucleic acid-binding protein